MKFCWISGLLFLMITMLSACGKMGNLYLPDDSLDSSSESQKTIQQNKGASDLVRDSKAE